MRPKRISIMPQEQSVIISPQSAFIFQCPWFIQRQCAGSPPLSPSHLPLVLSMISAALCRSVQIESGIDEDVATLVGGGLASSAFSWKSPPTVWDKQADGNADRQWERNVRWQCVLAVPHPPLKALSGFFWLVLWLLHSHTLYCASVCWLTFFPPWHGHALRVAHTSLIGWLHPLLALLVPPP